MSEMLLAQEAIDTMFEENACTPNPLPESELFQGLSMLTGDLKYAIKAYNRIMELDNE